MLAYPQVPGDLKGTFSYRSNKGNLGFTLSLWQWPFYKSTRRNDSRILKSIKDNYFKITFLFPRFQVENKVKIDIIIKSGYSLANAKNLFGNSGIFCLTAGIFLCPCK